LTIRPWDSLHTELATAVEFSRAVVLVPLTEFLGAQIYGSTLIVLHLLLPLVLLLLPLLPLLLLLLLPLLLLLLLLLPLLLLLLLILILTNRRCGA
jgi:hypothetical protein